MIRTIQATSKAIAKNLAESETTLDGMRTPERLEKFRRVIANRQFDLTVVLENVHDVHNVSAVLRSCDAVGVGEIYWIYNGIQKFPTLGEKSSASARKWVDQKRFTTVEECYSELRSAGFAIFTTHLDTNSTSLYELDLTKPVALVFGNEHSGVSEQARELADGNFVIPQMGMIQSLNISVACAVTLFEALRQRQEKGRYGQAAFTERQDALLNQWLIQK